MRDARVGSALADLTAATDALTLTRSRYLQRAGYPELAQFAVVPSLLEQLREAVVRSGETGAVSGSSPNRPPLDLDAVSLLSRIDQTARGMARRHGQRPRADLADTIRGLAAKARSWPRYEDVNELARAVCGWAGEVRGLLAETRTTRDLPELTCPRCKRKRVRHGEDPPVLAPALFFRFETMPEIVCRGCGAEWRGAEIHRLAAAQSALPAGQGSHVASASSGGGAASPDTHT